MFTNKDGKWWPFKPDAPKKVKIRHKKDNTFYKDLVRYFHPAHLDTSSNMQEMKRLWRTM